MGQIKLLTSLIMIGLFSIGILGFALNFAIDNDAPISIADDPEMSGLYSDSITSIEGFNDDVESGHSSLLNTTVQPGSNVPQSTAPFSVTPKNAFGVASDIAKTSYEKIFGTGAGFGIFFSAFIGLLLLMISLYIWKTFRGNPD